MGLTVVPDEAVASSSPRDAAPRAPRRALFLRHIRASRGAHLVFWNCFRWLRASPGWDADVWFTPQTIWNEQNPWFPDRTGVVERWDARDYDALVLGSWDWRHLPQEMRDDPPIPVVQLVLNAHFCDPAHPAFAFMRHPAVRVCCQGSIAQSLLDSRAVNGPCLANRHGSDTEHLPAVRPDSERDADVLICGIKRPDDAVRLARRLRWSPSLLGRRIDVLTHWIQRADFLDRISRARTAVFLPNPVEGFHQPPFEAMALGTLVVCPEFDDADMGFYVDRVNCLRCKGDVPSIARAAREAVRLPAGERARLVQAGLEAARGRTIDDERRDFLAVMESEAVRHWGWHRRARAAQTPRA